jgi:hypothetical protein
VGLFEWRSSSPKIPGKPVWLDLFVYIATLSNQTSHHQRMSMSSTISLSFRRDRSAQFLPSSISQGMDEAPSPRYHPAPSRNEIAFVQPVLVSFGVIP